MKGMEAPEYRRVTREQAREWMLEPSDIQLSIEGIGTLEKLGKARKGRVLMAHGAGAGQDSSFMQWLRQSLAENGVQTLAFEFVYMQRMREEKRRRPPPKIDILINEMALWCDIVSHEKMPAPWLGGKSLGGRVASMLAARDGAAGLVLCGYPFHPPRKPDRTRLAHWPGIVCPTVVAQGTRDPFGKRDEVESYDMPNCVKVHFLDDGEHDWKPRKASGLTQQQLIMEAAEFIAETMATSR